MSISPSEFDLACACFLDAVQVQENDSGWDKVTLIDSYNGRYLSVVRKLRGEHILLETGNDGAGESGIDEDDEEALNRPPSDHLDVRIVYDVIYSASYQVPVLYLTPQRPPQRPPQAHLDQTGSLLSPDEIYEALVPPQYRPQLEATGVMGALSMTEHPETGLPAYFIHPCRTAKAMRAVTGGVPANRETYLLQWLGLVGGCVGLEVSAKLADAISKVPLSHE